MRPAFRPTVRNTDSYAAPRFAAAEAEGSQCDAGKRKRGGLWNHDRGFEGKAVQNNDAKVLRFDISEADAGNPASMFPAGKHRLVVVNRCHDAQQDVIAVVRSYRRIARPEPTTHPGVGRD